MHSDRKKVHALKFQSAVAPNGLITNLIGPVQGKRHEIGMLSASDMLRELQQDAHGPNENLLCISADPVYPIRQQLMGSFSGAANTPL